MKGEVVENLVRGGMDEVEVKEEFEKVLGEM